MARCKLRKAGMPGLCWNLKRQGERGCTPITTPGPRWSAYVFNLRGMGLIIETIHESHEGPFPGTHARYVLHSPISILEEAL
jgi:hypothetical protein